MATPVSIAWLDSPPDSAAGVELYRALRPDAAFPFVTVGGEAGAPYEIVAEHGTPDRGVAWIEPFVVPPEDDEDFLAAWHAARAALARHRGWLGTRLHRSLGPAEFRFVVITRWSSPLMHARATGLKPAPDSRGALYQPV